MCYVAGVSHDLKVALALTVPTAVLLLWFGLGWSWIGVGLGAMLVLVFGLAPLVLALVGAVQWAGKRLGRYVR